MNKPNIDIVKKKKKIQLMFDNIAIAYDKANKILSLGIDIYWRKTLINKLNIKPHEKILDLCSGTGDLSLLAKKKGGTVISIDFSLNMIKYGIKKQKLNSNVIIGDVSKLPFKSNTFDKIIIGFGIRNIQDLDEFLQEVYRVLKPGGLFAVLELTRPRRNIFRILYIIYLKLLLPLVGGIISKNIKAYKYLSQTISNFVDPPSLVAMHEKYGFENIKIHSLTFSIATIFISQKKRIDKKNIFIMQNKEVDNRPILH